MHDHLIDISRFKERYVYDPKQDQLPSSSKQTRIFQAKEAESGDKIVIKLYSGKELSQELFLNEAQQTLRYAHENLTRYLDYYIVQVKNFFGEADFQFASIEEYISGAFFANWMKEQAQHDEQETQAIFGGILHGLNYLQDEGITHGNLNPANIILKRVGEAFIPKLANYGFTKLFEAKKSSSGNLLIGTSGYLPPEKIASSQGLRIAANLDLWNFGVILYEYFVGATPFGSKEEGHTLGQIFNNVLSGNEPPKLRTLPDPYQEMVRKCLVKDPKDRIKSAHELLQLLGLPERVSVPAATAAPKPVPEEALPPESKSEAPPQPESSQFARVIMLGDEKSGKSSLVRKLTMQKEVREDSGPGVVITSHSLQLKSQTVQANIWDFGGQEILNSLHQFFMAERSVYVLVWDAAQDDKTGLIEDWLNMINTFGGDAPVIVVVNKADVRPFTFNERQLKLKFPAIRTFLQTSCKTGDGIDALREEIKESIETLSYMTESLPMEWVQIISRLSSMDDNYLDYSEYRRLCREFDLDHEEQEKLIQLLHDLGLLLNFRNDATLSGTSILRPDWITRGVFSIINHPSLDKNEGVLALDQLKDILDPNEFPPEKHIVLMGLMERFQMCFPIGNQQRHYLFPAALPDQWPEYAWDDKRNLTFEYRYNFLPQSVFPRFIVRMRNYLDGKLIWRHGIVLQGKDNPMDFMEEEKTMAEVTEDHKARRIRIRIVGEVANKFLFMVRMKFEEIHAEFPNLKVEELIPCICSQCSQSDEPHLFEYAIVQRYKDRKRRNITCEKSIEEVSLAKLTREIIQPKDATETQIIKKETKIHHDPAPLENYLKNTTKILFLASNPMTTGRLRLDEEFREIESSLRSSGKRDRFQLVPKLAVRIDDFQRAMLRNNPTIVHFSGHGTSTDMGQVQENGTRGLEWENESHPQGGIIFEYGKDQARLISGEELGELFELFPTVDCVILNACHSQTQAAGILKHVEFVIGMNREVPDQTAIVFAKTFYESIGEGKDFEFAFKYAKQALRLQKLPGSDIPELLKKN